MIILLCEPFTTGSTGAWVPELILADVLHAYPIACGHRQEIDFNSPSCPPLCEVHSVRRCSCRVGLHFTDFSLRCFLLEQVLR